MFYLCSLLPKFSMHHAAAILFYGCMASTAALAMHLFNNQFVKTLKLLCNSRIHLYSLYVYILIFFSRSLIQLQMHFNDLEIKVTEIDDCLPKQMNLPIRLTSKNP